MTGPWARARDVLSRPTSDGLVVLPAGGRTAATLTGLDHDVWAQLAQPLDVGQVVDRLSRGPHGAPAPETADVQQSLARLLRRGLVTSP